MFGEPQLGFTLFLGFGSVIYLLYSTSAATTAKTNFLYAYIKVSSYAWQLRTPLEMHLMHHVYFF